MKKYYFAIIAFCFLSFANGQIINFSDANFKAKLLLSSSNNQIARNLSDQNFAIDTNNDGQIQQSEALQVSWLTLGGNNLTSLIGIEFFTELRVLLCDYNQLTSLNINTLTFLESIYCTSNQLTTLNLSGMDSLTTVDCHANQLTSLNVTGLTNLLDLRCYDNKLVNLNLTGLTNLTSVSCNNNLLENLNVNDLLNLTGVGCGNNKLTSLNVTNLVNLKGLSCQNNQLTTLDLTANNSLVYGVNCSYNNLLAIYIKNGYNEVLTFNNNPNLSYICTDDGQVNQVQNLINNYGYSSTCSVSSYCSFLQGGINYLITGKNKFDNNDNGCDLLDSFLPNLKFNLSNGQNNGNLISDSSGNYLVPVLAGTHTITPILENPDYFTVYPFYVSTTFPDASSPAIRDFCVTANGVHNDLEVSLLPVNVARPGFDARYKLVYRNKGNQTQSGAVNFTFNDTVLDFITANPATSTQVSNNLSWNFIDLKPFETREIAVTLNANSPMEIPALNSNDILPFIANVTSTNDETPNDNTAILNQTVVNSFDPNDKTCLEGNSIAPAKVGEYVHYMIRFENTGTFAAQNIVVKDMIDLAKFDIASLIPVKGSHDFYTRINGNKVEFIFENINLPFADATNDGYVAFKIKTKSTLVLGNTFSNSANIYFDYNFPIVTNTATTTITNPLAIKDFEFTNYFKIYPNPVKNSLNIETKNDIIISSLSIYNTLGQLVQVITSPNKTVDVSELKSGNYFIKIVSGKGTSNSKFLKE